MGSAYDFDITTLEGETYALSRYRGQPLLLVNVASRCGFTPQYAGLEQLWQERRGQGLVVIGFPCNQFGAQEPGDAAQIRAFCSLEYPVTFPLSAKIDVNGPHADPLWQWLSTQKRGVLGTARIKWNFTKFLIDREGQVEARFAPTTKPEQIF
ncbi:glutathione peroxidase [Stenotrophomonas sp. WHRI 8082]|uniref:glutathione peroxidase n=1 Tax=unclassified Stenotrophomonas TaxID=196198 RepID=UPI001783EB56|nr:MULTISPECIES: glutathione peroxidase [unclassified Stenotrophomonas]MBD8636245.1 glutathione peroxidase [Stenotrophomonas sp. CFBP 13725]MBD8696434.1 glutathione peroxidase [Stenotrophomonas sp. CFBP 13718]